MIDRDPTPEEVYKNRLYLERQEKRSAPSKEIEENEERGRTDALQNFNTKNLYLVISIVERHNTLLQAYQDAKLDRLKEICAERGHNIAPTDIDWDKWSAGSAVCIDCGKDFGWYCPKNPDPKKPYCEYDEKHGESCIHCGLPEERK